MMIGTHHIGYAQLQQMAATYSDWPGLGESFRARKAIMKRHCAALPSCCQVSCVAAPSASWLPPFMWSVGKEKGSV